MINVKINNLRQQFAFMARRSTGLQIYICLCVCAVRVSLIYQRVPEGAAAND